jgi:hypothetical protein
MKAFEGGVEPFVLSGEAAEPCRPGEAAFDDPTAWQQQEASFCHRVLDHFEPQAMLLGGLGSGGAGVTLVYIGQFDRAAGHLLHLLGQRATCSRSPRSAGVTVSASKCPNVSTAMWTFDPLRRLAPS